MRKKRAKKKVHGKKVWVRMSEKEAEKLRDLIAEYNRGDALFNAQNETLIQEQRQVIRLLAMMETNLENKKNAARKVEKLLKKHGYEIERLMRMEFER